MNRNETTTLGFLIFPGFPMACLTSAIEPLRAANEISGQTAFSWHLLSETGAPVTSSAAVRFEPDRALLGPGPAGDAAPDLDFLFLLSGPQGGFADPRAGAAEIRRLARRGVGLGAVSGGVFPLVRSGVMAGFRCSVHWCYAAAFRAEFPDITADEDVIVIDGRRSTASGAAAAFDLMLRLIGERLGADVATEVACWFQHPLVRGEGVRQKIPAFRTTATDDMLPPAVARAVRLMAARIAEPVPLEEIAGQAGVSARQMERQFKQATGQSPSHYYRALRLKAARQLVVYSNDSMAEIAHAVGYASSTPLVQHYREAFGLTPQQDRARVNQSRVQDNRALPSV